LTKILLRALVAKLRKLLAFVDHHARVAALALRGAGAPGGGLPRRRHHQ
jgi:hypothetical protein